MKGSSGNGRDAIVRRYWRYLWIGQVLARRCDLRAMQFRTNGEGGPSGRQISDANYPRMERTDAVYRSDLEGRRVRRRSPNFSTRLRGRFDADIAAPMLLNRPDQLCPCGYYRSMSRPFEGLPPSVAAGSPSFCLPFTAASIARSVEFLLRSSLWLAVLGGHENCHFMGFNRPHFGIIRPNHPIRQLCDRVQIEDVELQSQ